MSADLHELTAVYALDALSGEEQARFEEHLEECTACRQEVAELQATLGEIGEVFEEAPPAGLKDLVLAEIDQTPQERSPGETAAPGDGDMATTSPTQDAAGGAVDEFSSRRHAAPQSRAEGDAGDGRVDELAARRAAPKWVTGMMATAAGIVVILVVGVSVIVTNLNERIDELEAATSDMTEMLATPDAQAVTVEGPDGSFVRVVMSASRGEAMFLADGMDPAPHEHTYELWLIDDEGAHSAGVFDVDETGRVTQLMSGDMERTAAIGVTVEPEGGSPEPTTDPVMLIDFEEA